MNIMICTDESYFKIAQVLLNSISNKCSEQIVCYLVSDSLTPKDIQKIKHNNIEIKLIYIENSLIRNFPISGHISLAAYYRILAIKVLPDTVDRILYLDCDIIVNKDLNKLYNQNFEDKEIIACEDKKISQRMRNVYEAIGMNYKTKYFNSGVILFNVEKLRINSNFENEIFQFVQENHKKLQFHDQDVLNHYFEGKVKYLNEKKYNYIVKFIKNQKEAKWVQKNSSIIHYADRRKPWNYDYIGYLDELWWKNAKKVFTKKEYKNYLKKHLKYKILPFRILRKIKSIFIKDM